MIRKRKEKRATRKTGIPAEEKMMKCSKCSAELEDNAKFCPQCGAPVGDDYVQHEQSQAQYQSQQQGQAQGQPQGQSQGYAQSQPQGNTTYVYQRTNGFAIAGLVLSIVWICVALVLLLAGACTLSSLYFWGF